MAQPQSPRTKKSLDVLQSMINGILIEMGKALQASDKEAGRSMGAANMRLKTTIPSAVEAFHAALDELECDIVRAKAVLGRDLEQLRAQRYAAENPATEVPEETLKLDPLPEPTESFQAPIAVMAPSQPSPGPVIKEEVAPVKSPQAQEPSNHPTPSDPPKETILAMREDKKGPEVPSPQPANETKHNMIGLGIDTSGAANSEIAAPSTGENQDSAIDSLFGDMTESNDNTSNDQSTNLKFDDMDFFIHDSNSNTQNQEQPQAENQEFDLSTFGDPVHGNDGNLDFSMTDLQPSNEANTGDDNASNEVANKQDDLTDIFGGLDDNAGGADFDDMFFGTGDDGGMSGGGIGGIEHGEFDDAFFGLDK